MAKVLIRNEDGYQKTADFTDPVGNCPTFRFSFRPALPAAVYAYKFAPKPNGEEMLKQITKILLKHLTGWDVEDDKGVAELTEANLLRVPIQALDFMVDAITGYEKSGEMAADAKN